MGLTTARGIRNEEENSTHLRLVGVCHHQSRPVGKYRAARSGSSSE
ncbi:hypothetical protein TNCV_4356061, partial [Trichonephila clavipes]